ncbi:transmembrane protease serine 9-like [Palaemon carinicauda]|uniref:transmembrane protease serine 9-like n=1 Tax=Palaemon carinicauda TaxID=392227 RepID=UPI0035B66D21
MWCHLIITAVTLLKYATPTSLESLTEYRQGTGLLCGNYSIDVDQTLYIKSKKFAQPYPKNYVCDYTFYCTDYAGIIVFNCNTFELQNSNNCQKDFVRVYDNNVVDEKYCGTSPPQNVPTGGNFLGVKFKSDDDDIQKSGFFCSVKCGHAEDKTTSTVSTMPTTTTSTTTQSTTSTTRPPISTPDVYRKCECGVAVRSSPSRIVGGNDAEAGEYPWQAAITPRKVRTPICGASLLNNKYVITAAHCVDAVPDFSVLFAEHDYLSVSKVLIRAPARVSVHPDYDASTQINDLAIIELDSPINLDAADIAAKPICLPDPATDFTGMTAIATGWGATSETGLPSSTLQEVEITVASDSDCSSGPSILCAGESEGGKDTCVGDDGGPLIVEVDGRYVLAGVTNIKRRCARPGSLGKYTRVQSSLDWITAEISDGKTCGTDASVVTLSTSLSTAESTSSTTPVSTASTSTTSATTSTTTTTTTTTTTVAPTLNPGLQCACGIPTEPHSTASHLYNHPWTVALIQKSTGRQYCTGTIINTLFILTAQTCNRVMSDMQVRANAQDLTTEVTRIINRDVVSIVTNGDLILLELGTPLSLTNWGGIKPACLPNNQNFVNAPATHSGYGNIYPSTTPSNTVKIVNGNVIFCSGLGPQNGCFQPGTSKGFCGADIGGPIVAEGGNGRKYLAGIALKDNGCATEAGMIFQEMAIISPYYQWIWDGAQAGRFCVL